MRTLTTITKNLLIINVLAFLATVVFSYRGIDLQNLFGLHFFYASDFQPWQFVTYMFMHANITHLFFNMFALWMFGCTVERVWGAKRFLLFYLVCGLGAGLCQEISQFVQFQIELTNQFPGASAEELAIITENSSRILNAWTTVGASGAVYGILLGFGLTFPEERIFIFPIPFPIKGKWFVCIYVVVELFMALATSGDGVAHVAHLGGMLFGYLMIRYWRSKSPYNGYGGWGNGRSYGSESIGKRIKKWFGKTFAKKNSDFDKKGTWTSSTTKNADWEYNKQQNDSEKEIDRILEKISRSGYESLSDSEKKKLFDRK